MARHLRSPLPIVAVLSGLLISCTREPNYLHPRGPRYAGDHTTSEPSPRAALRVVSYNLLLGRKVDVAIAALRTEPLAGADLVLMQEMDAAGVDRIARALGLRYVYYPASIKKGRDWGNAILSRWPIRADHKVLLPHPDPYSNTRRIAVAATIDLGDDQLLVYSVHTNTPTLGMASRLEQLNAILVDAGDTSPAVIGGDFNTSDPGSKRKLLELLAKNNIRWASNRATASNSRLGVDFTLDFIFARGLVAGASGTFAGEAGSDHRPIWVVLRMP